MPYQKKIQVITAWIETLTQTIARFDWVALLLIRITVGTVFLKTGWGKLHNLPKIIDFFRELGIPAPELQAPFVAGTEFVCGSLILVGLLTRLASIPLAITMGVAILTAKRSEIESLVDLLGLSEFLYIALFAALFFYGAGKVSLDRILVSQHMRPKRQIR